MRARRPNLRLGILLAATSVSCGAFDAKHQAEEVVSGLFETLATEAPDSVLKFYHPQFFAQTPDTSWLQILNQVRQKLGQLGSYSLTRWHVGRQAGDGAFVELVYSVQYENYAATETLVLRKNREGLFRIATHKIESLGLLRE